MNIEMLLAVIGDLEVNRRHLTAENAQLRAKLEELASAPSEKPAKDE